MRRRACQYCRYMSFELSHLVTYLSQVDQPRRQLFVSEYVRAIGLEPLTRSIRQRTGDTYGCYVGCSTRKLKQNNSQAEMNQAMESGDVVFLGSANCYIRPKQQSSVELSASTYQDSRAMFWVSN